MADTLLNSDDLKQLWSVWSMLLYCACDYFKQRHKTDRDVVRK